MTSSGDTLGSVLRDGFRLIGRFVRARPWSFALAVSGALVFVSAIVLAAFVVGRVTDELIIPVLNRGEVLGSRWKGAMAAVIGVSTWKAGGIILRRMAADGNPYKGVIYAGLMMTADGPKVLEFNCRMGDPETQVVLPRMSSDLLPVAQAAATGSLAGVDMTWKPQPSTGVVLTSGGYPGEYRRGIPIAGLNDIDSDVLVFHAGTKLDDSGQLVTNGGRVLTIVALGDTMAEARERAYANASRVRFEGVHYRKDIALRVAESGVHT